MPDASKYVANWSSNVGWYHLEYNVEHRGTGAFESTRIAHCGTRVTHFNNRRGILENVNRYIGVNQRIYI